MFSKEKGGSMREEIRVMYSESKVNQKVVELAEQINKDYEGKRLHLICLLKGSIFFFCEQPRRIWRN